MEKPGSDEVVQTALEKLAKMPSQKESILERKRRIETNKEPPLGKRRRTSNAVPSAVQCSAVQQQPKGKRRRTSNAVPSAVQFPVQCSAAATKRKSGRPTMTDNAVPSAVQQQPKGKAADRVLNNSGQSLKAESKDSLRCIACRESVNTKTGVLNSHLISKKHLNNLEMYMKNAQKDSDIKIALKVYDKEAHTKGETLDPAIRVFRLDVLQTFMSAGVPIAKMDTFRPLFQKYVFPLTSSDHMRDLILFVREQEVALVSKEILNKYLCVIFDGTTRQGEVLNVVVRFTNEERRAKQLLIKVKIYEASLSGIQVCQSISDLLLRTYQIHPEKVVSVVRDGAAVNNVAVEHMAGLFPNIMSIVCFSHTFDRVGVYFNVPVASRFMKHYGKLF
eukprot:Pompholyxophrys_punicea_v1_NODE_508_length_1810_cov_3.367521.p1 type:complete len:390 gc:universal NODE_508_length_1810_cov_3.367521:416-1585(+)